MVLSPDLCVPRPQCRFVNNCVSIDPILQEIPMNTMIIDRFSSLPLSRRLLWTSLTCMGWALFTSLWLPLLGATAILVGTASPETTAAAHSFGELFHTLASHLVAIMIAIGFFLGWSVLQNQATKHGRDEKRDIVSSSRLAQSVRLDADDLGVWQRAQRLVVMHDETSGWISGVRIMSAVE